MIANYTNHAANERTFLAWLRTDLAVTAFGFFLAKRNVFFDAVAGPRQSSCPWRCEIDRDRISRMPQSYAKPVHSAVVSITATMFCVYLALQCVRGPPSQTSTPDRKASPGCRNRETGQEGDAPSA